MSALSLNEFAQLANIVVSSPDRLATEIWVAFCTLTKEKLQDLQIEIAHGFISEASFDLYFKLRDSAPVVEPVVMVEEDVIEPEIDLAGALVKTMKTEQDLNFEALDDALDNAVDQAALLSTRFAQQDTRSCVESFDDLAHLYLKPSHIAALTKEIKRYILTLKDEKWNWEDVDVSDWLGKNHGRVTTPSFLKPFVSTRLANVFKDRWFKEQFENGDFMTIGSFITLSAERTGSNSNPQIVEAIELAKEFDPAFAGIYFPTIDAIVDVKRFETLLSKRINQKRKAK